MRLSKGVKDVSSAVVSNLIVTAVSIIISIIVPIYLSIEDYGYWQINVLYGGYVGFLHLGWIDGMYIRYVGQKYETLNKRSFQSQLFTLTLFEVFISIVSIFAIHLISGDQARAFALGAVFIASAISIPRGMLLFILQATSRIKEYSIANCVGRIIYFVVCILMLLLGVKSFAVLLVANIFGLLCSTICAIYYCKDIVFCMKGKFVYQLSETIENIKCGCKITIAYLSGNMIIGLVKAIVARKWDISSFSMVSFAISISSIIMILINAIGTVILPIIKNVKENELPILYDHMSKTMMLLLPYTLLLFYPVKIMVIAFLPKYTQSINLLSFLFPICLFECRMGLVNNTLLKALRKENHLLVINVASLILTAVLAYFCAFVLNNYNCTIIVMVLMIAVRCSTADIVLSRFMKISITRDLVTTCTMALAFVIINGFCTTGISCILYIVCIVLHMRFSAKYIKPELSWIRHLLLRKTNNSNKAEE